MQNLKIVFILLFGFLLFLPILQYHPFENTYFNVLIGGLKGAKEKEIPSWGNTYGSVYLQGIEWLNKNVEENARLALPINYISVIPRIKLRSDIDLDNNHFSGPNRLGEYAMELSYDWPLKSRYKYAYYDNFLDPVYEIKVDDVAILKIWKNDLKHTKNGYDKEVVIMPKIKSTLKELENTSGQKKLQFDLEKEVRLTRLIIKHSDIDCQKQDGVGYISTSKNWEDWIREPDLLVDPEKPKNWMEMDENKFVFMFPGRLAKSIYVNTELENPCILKNPEVTVMGLE